MYPQKLHNFLNESPNRSTVFFKALTSPDRFKNTIEKYKDLFEEFHSISFPVDLTFSEKLNWIKNNIHDQPICKSCGSKLEISKGSGKYAEYCNNRCYFNNLSKVNPYAKPVIIKGTEYLSVNEACEKLEISYFNLKNMIYGKEYPEYYYKNNHKENIENDLGGKHPKLLDYEWLIKQKNDYITMFEICDELDVKLDVLRLAFYYHGIPTTYDQIPRESQELLKNKEWLEKQVKEKRPGIIAEELQCSVSLIFQKCDELDIEMPSFAGSQQEEEVADFIKSLGIEIIQRTRKIIKPYELDIYIPSMNLAIEFNGIWYHREDPSKHQLKYNLCAEKQIRLIQIFGDDWEHKRELIKKKIIHILKLSKEKRIFARKCIVKEITSADARRFYSSNHLYGHRNCKYHFGLIHNGILVAAMSFHQNKLERYATSHTIIGGFGKLLKFSVDELNLSEVITFADLSWSDIHDNIYVKNGFELIGTTSPNYFWVVNGKRQSRLKYQKHKLKTLPSYEENKSERKIMEEMGYYRIFDAGHAKFSLKLD